MVRFDVDGLRFLTDPLLRLRIGPLRSTGPAPPDTVADVDVVLLSHLHHDHCDLPSLRLLAPHVRLVAPRGSRGLLEHVVAGPVHELAAGGSVRWGGVTVTATPALHVASRRHGTGVVQPVGYLVEGSTSVYFAGDTDLFPAMADLAGADTALLPVGGWGLNLGPGHLDPLRAATALRLLRPAVAVPVHWGSLRLPAVWRVRPDPYLRPGPDFRRHAARLAPGVDVQVLSVGQRVRPPGGGPVTPPAAAAADGHG